MDKNAQQPVAFSGDVLSYIRSYGGSCRDCADGDGVCPSSGLPCGDPDSAITHVLNALAYGINNGFLPSPFTAPPVPRDVLMAFGEAVRDAAKRADFDIGEDVDLAAIADRYASKVPPEPVNQQLLAALKQMVGYVFGDIEAGKSDVCDRLRSIIAAAEAAQPIVKLESDTEAGKWALAWNAALVKSAHILGMVAGDSLTDVPEVLRQRLASSAKPVAVPDGWQLVPKEPTPEMLEAAWQYHGTVAYNKLRPDYETDAECYRAMLSAAQKTEGV